MTTGYTFRPLIKQVPQNGTEVIVDLTLAFTDMAGTKALGLKYEQDVEGRPDYNRRMRPLKRGFRMKADLQFWIREITQHPTYVDILNRLMDPDDEWATYLSIDAGATYDEVWAKSNSGPRAINGKTFNGADETLSLESVSLLRERPYLAGQYALPLTAEPFLSVLPPTIAMRGQIRYVRAQNGAPGQLVVYGEKGDGNPDVQVIWDFGP